MEKLKCDKCGSVSDNCYGNIVGGKYKTLCGKCIYDLSEHVEVCAKITIELECPFCKKLQIFELSKYYYRCDCGVILADKNINSNFLCMRHGKKESK